MTSLRMRRLATIIAAAVLCATVVTYVDSLQAASLKKSFGKLRYYGGPKSPMWRG